MMINDDNGRDPILFWNLHLSFFSAIAAFLLCIKDLWCL